jgi:hypothetical protein
MAIAGLRGLQHVAAESNPIVAKILSKEAGRESVLEVILRNP